MVKGTFCQNVCLLAGSKKTPQKRRILPPCTRRCLAPWTRTLRPRAGLQLLTWLGKLEDSPLRTLSIRITTGAMQQALGDEGYKKALESDVVASTTVQNAGPEREIERPAPEGVSILAAMDSRGTDQTERLRGMPATEGHAMPPRTGLPPAQPATNNRPTSILTSHSARRMKSGKRELQKQMPRR